MAGGPYYEGQKPSKCGCYYPDVVPQREVGVIVFNCTTHGEVTEERGSKAMLGEERKVTPKWREEQRVKLSKLTREQLEGVLKTRQHVHVRSVTILVETDDGAFMKTYPTSARLMTYKGKDGVVHDDSDNMVVQADIRFLDPKFIQEPAGWIYQERAGS